MVRGEQAGREYFLQLTRGAEVVQGEASAPWGEELQRMEGDMEKVIYNVLYRCCVYMYMYLVVQVALEEVVVVLAPWLPLPKEGRNGRRRDEEMQRCREGEREEGREGERDLLCTLLTGTVHMYMYM